MVFKWDLSKSVKVKLQTLAQGLLITVKVCFHIGRGSTEMYVMHTDACEITYVKQSRGKNNAYEYIQHLWSCEQNYWELSVIVGPS